MLKNKKNLKIKKKHNHSKGGLIALPIVSAMAVQLQEWEQ